MNDVFEKTRLLGQSILDSEEFKVMKAAEAAAMADSQTAELMSKYLEYKGQLEELLQSNDPDPVQLANYSNQMEECQTAMASIDAVGELTLARHNFQQLIEQVNQVLRFIITGEIEEEKSGCGGECSGCGGGCGHRH